MIDPRKPLRFAGSDKRVVTLVGVMPNGNIVATSNYTDGTPWSTPLTFDRTTGSNGGPGALVIENAPVVDSGFWPLRQGSGEPYGRGLTLLSTLWWDHSEAKHAVEIVRQDGVPIEAKIHARP